jgi:hypothetical protein
MQDLGVAASVGVADFAEIITTNFVISDSHRSGATATTP